MTEILGKAVLAPSSVNMQPWRFVVVESPKGKAKLASILHSNQSQLETSSAIIAVFGDLNNFDYAEEIYGAAVACGLMTVEVKESQLAQWSPYFATRSLEVNKNTVLIDGGLVSMQLMLVARAYGYDTNPIGGYDKDKAAEAFGLDKERYVPVMLISIGKAAEDGYETTRLPVEQVTTWE